MADSAYDSKGDTLEHSLRVGELMVQMIQELSARSVAHDLSKTHPPEKEVFDEFTPKLQATVYGSDEYRANLEAMAPALVHHYSVSRHHPEHFSRGVNGMTLVDLIEMLADWKATTERSPTGDLIKSLAIQRGRFRLDPQMLDVLVNTAHHFGWIPQSSIHAQTTGYDGLRQHLFATHHERVALEFSDADALCQHDDLHGDESQGHDRADLSYTEQEMADARRWSQESW